MTRTVMVLAALVFALSRAAAAERPLEVNTVTVEGAGVESISADLLKMEFLVSVRRPSPASAYADVDAAADRLEKGVRAVVGTAGEFERGAKTLARHIGPESAGYEAAMPATFSTGGFPRARADLDAFTERVTENALALDVVAPRTPMPRIYYETRLTRAIEERLAQAALRDAKNRAATVARMLGRVVRTTSAQSARFPATVTVDGAVYAIDSDARPVVSDKPAASIEYVVRVTFVLE